MNLIVIQNHGKGSIKTNHDCDCLKQKPSPLAFNRMRKRVYVIGIIQPEGRLNKSNRTKKFQLVITNNRKWNLDQSGLWTLSDLLFSFFSFSIPFFLLVFWFFLSRPPQSEEGRNSYGRRRPHLLGGNQLEWQGSTKPCSRSDRGKDHCYGASLEQTMPVAPIRCGINRVWLDCHNLLLVPKFTRKGEGKAEGRREARGERAEKGLFGERERGCLKP